MSSGFPLGLVTACRFAIQEQASAHPKMTCAMWLCEFGLTPKGRLGVELAPALRVNKVANHSNGNGADKYFDGPRPWERRE